MSVNPYTAPSAELVEVTLEPSRLVVHAIRCGIGAGALLCAACWFMFIISIWTSLQRGMGLFGGFDPFSYGAGGLACVLPVLVFTMFKRNLLGAMLFFAVTLGLLGQVYRVGSLHANLGSILLVGTSACAALGMYGVFQHRRLIHSRRNILR